MTTIDTKSKDIYLDENGQIAVSKDLDSYRVIVESLLNTILGEVQSNVDYGIDYMNTVFSSVSNTSLWEADVRSKIKSLPFVYSVDRFAYEWKAETKELEYDMILATDLGVVYVKS